VARTVVAPPSVVKCLWEVFVWGLGCCFCRVRVCRCRGCCSLSVCVGGGGGPTPQAATRVAASTPPPKHLDIFQGAPLRLPKPLSDQFPVRVCSCPLCIITVCDHGRSIFFRKPPASQTCVPRLAWPSQKQRNKALTLAHARDCHDQYCMVYGIQTGGRGGRHILRNGRAIVLQ